MNPYRTKLYNVAFITGLFTLFAIPATLLSLLTPAADTIDALIGVFAIASIYAVVGTLAASISHLSGEDSTREW